MTSTVRDMFPLRLAQQAITLTGLARRSRQFMQTAECEPLCEMRHSPGATFSLPSSRVKHSEPASWPVSWTKAANSSNVTAGLPTANCRET
jgi:hypothetical protein